jgi:hypothetical protein
MEVEVAVGRAHGGGCGEAAVALRVEVRVVGMRSGECAQRWGRGVEGIRVGLWRRPSRGKRKWRSRARGGRVRPRERGMEERSLQHAEGRG